MFTPTIEDCIAVSNTGSKKADGSLMFRLGYLLAIYDTKGERMFKVTRGILFCDDIVALKKIKEILE